MKSFHIEPCVDGWMASLTRWVWVWMNSGSWWWTGRPGVLRFMGSQGVRHDWGTELNWTKLNWVRVMRASLVAQLVMNPPAMQETPFRFLVGKIPWRRDKLPTPVFLGFSGSSAGKESTCNAGDLGLIPRLGGSPGEGKGYSLQYSGLKIPWAV